MSDRPTQTLSTRLFASLMAVRMQKIRVTYQSIPEILRNQEYSEGIAYSGEGGRGGVCYRSTRMIPNSYHKSIKKTKNPLLKTVFLKNLWISHCKSIYDSNLRTGIFLDMQFLPNCKNHKKKKKKKKRTFILDHFQTKLINSFSLKAKNPVSGPFLTFLGIFPKKIMVTFEPIKSFDSRYRCAV